MTDTALLQGLLANYSPTGQEAGAVEFLVEEMRRRGFSAAVDDLGNAVGSIGSGPNEIVLLGHIDTVPGQIEVHREGDQLFGRGAVDAKGPLACFVEAASQVAVPTGCKITLIGAVAEEGDSRGAKFVVDKHAPKFTIIGEPSGWERVTLGYKGSSWFEYSVEKTMAHTASAQESACEAAVNFWNSLKTTAAEFNQDKPRVFDQLTPTLRAMNSESGEYVETARLRVGMRLPSQINLEQAVELTSNLAGEGQVKLIDGVSAWRADKNNALVRAFLGAIRAEQGTPGFVLKTGTSDMNIVAPAWGCPIVAYGPGDSNLDHTPGEYILVSEYLAGVRVLAKALASLIA
ncbi:MAG: [LysW]-lysine hydrolase [Anaerolineaceae bacterium]